MSRSRSSSPIATTTTREARPTPKPDVLLLNDDFSLSDAFCQILANVFRKYAAMQDLEAAPITEGVNDVGAEVDANTRKACLTRAQLNRFAMDTNGREMDDDTFKEIAEFLACVKVDGQPALTYKGFVQLYQLQTENDLKETWADLEKWGYNRQLELTSSTAAASEEVATTTAEAVVPKKKRKNRKKKKSVKKLVEAANGNGESTTDVEGETEGSNE